MARDPNSQWKQILIIVPIVGTASATILYVLRLYARHMITQKLRIEDIIMGLGLIFTWGVAACVVYGRLDFTEILAYSPSASKSLDHTISSSTS
ncbi:hypothetical protein PENSTE_c017G06150 [Penicillium steckii]|uniref:Uncharacterized protein n=1 Tax=Penicillium steckii TaxID=303698 RepID=A0A1V6SXD4_9EURO|nr:hypothetical protein PENSTE_c017G06150 [Penicillium steckii]